MDRHRAPPSGPAPIDRERVWECVRAERVALVDDLWSLPDARWATPSLCPGWDVHDVVAHLVHDARTTRTGFVRDLVAAGLSLDRANARGLARARRRDPRLTLATLESVSGRTTSAPAPLATRLVEVLVHGEDVRRPLGIGHDYPLAPVLTALAYQARTAVGLGGGRERAAGLRLVATDAGVMTGHGPEARGSALTLLLALSGRPVRPGEITGPGARALDGRGSPWARWVA